MTGVEDCPRKASEPMTPIHIMIAMNNAIAHPKKEAKSVFKNFITVYN